MKSCPGAPSRFGRGSSRIWASPCWKIDGVDVLVGPLGNTSTGGFQRMPGHGQAGSIALNAHQDTPQ